MSILHEIVARKRADLPAFVERHPLDDLKRRAAERAPAPPFAEALRAVPMGLVAEVKFRSPSAGILREPFEPAALARAYAEAGAQAVSVLVDEPYFGGGEHRLLEVRGAVDLPLLYKEFVVDPWQVWHAAACGASAVLLIAAVLDDRDLTLLMGLCDETGLESLVEVHDEEEMDRAAEAGASTIGVNNRNLLNFEVSLDTTYRLVQRAPAGCTFISESGIRSAEDVCKLQQSGAHAVLVGESLLRQPDPGLAARELMRSTRETGT